MFPIRLRGIIVVLAILAIVACSNQPAVTFPMATPGGEQIEVRDLAIASGQTVYVPAYSEVPFAPGRTLALAVTLAIHNTDPVRPIIITSVRYHGADGRLIEEFLTEPRRLDPLATADIVVEGGRQTGGGIGTNFIVEWVAEEPVYEPIIEAIMLNATGNQGISFISPGRVVSQIE
jgi:hypothetical protein